MFRKISELNRYEVATVIVQTCYLRPSQLGFDSWRRQNLFRLQPIGDSGLHLFSYTRDISMGLKKLVTNFSYSRNLEWLVLNLYTPCDWVKFENQRKELLVLPRLEPCTPDQKSTALTLHRYSQSGTSWITSQGRALWWDGHVARSVLSWFFCLLKRLPVL